LSVPARVDAVGSGTLSNPSAPEARFVARERRDDPGRPAMPSPSSHRAERRSARRARGVRDDSWPRTSLNWYERISALSVFSVGASTWIRLVAVNVSEPNTLLTVSETS
jgi:hypothetical protein